MFSRKKKSSNPGTASTFVQATGGGWSDSPDTLAADGGTHADFVGRTLERARAYAQEHKISIGEEFTFTITDIPVGISSPHEITVGLMMRAQDYGLVPGVMIDEKIVFTRLS